MSKKYELKRKSRTAEQNLLDLTCYFGISEIRHIAAMVREQGMRVEDACEKKGIVGNERSTLYLLFARECYATGLLDLGDQYIRKVEHMEEKSGYVIEMMNLVQKNRFFFPNRVNENQKRFQLVKTR